MRAADNVNPHGIPRPSRVDLARAFLVRVADVLDVDDVDGAALDTLVHALDWLDVLDVGLITDDDVVGDPDVVLDGDGDV